ncbi:MAG TPA: DUF1275 domain-containing protein [Spirochaetaceae bacterium]|jgi:uncharacterized membrane protein YoaK (UPF0700 family)|nr:DUF1275 domain-containing protein [Spirochaetaceae bacterium]
MLSKLPAWVGIGAFLLAFTAGSVNVFVLESALHQSVTHHSGSASAMALALAQGVYAQAAYFFFLILAFIVGSILSGFLIRDYHLKLGRRYGISLILESLAICLAWALFERAPYASLLMLSGASGLQNALATTYSGAIIRTTHLTGIFTDIGVLVGNRLAGIAMPEKKLKLLSIILLGFLAGGLSSGLLYPPLGSAVLALPAFITGSIGISYFLYRHFGLK